MTEGVKKAESLPGFEEFVEAYMQCALFTEMDNADDTGGEPLDSNYGIDDIAEESKARMRVDCARFLDDERVVAVIADEHLKRESIYGVMGAAGHDFWLTRNGHGAGFWDGDWTERADRVLTPRCEAFGQVDLFVGDDGLIHHM